MQGEGGARAVPDVCLRGLRELCDAHGVLLIYDEVQCGLGRTGKLFAYEWSGRGPRHHGAGQGAGRRLPGRRVPGDGVEAAKGMTVGAHGSTYGGNPLAMAVGLSAVAGRADERT